MVVMARAKKIFCVVAYDISDDRRRNQVVKLLDKYGERVNFSVYECLFTAGRFKQIQEAVLKRINTDEDQVVYYPICVNCYTRIVYQPKEENEQEAVLMA